MKIKTQDEIQDMICRAYAKRLQLIIRAIKPERLTKRELTLARYWVNKPIF